MLWMWLACSAETKDTSGASPSVPEHTEGDDLAWVDPEALPTVEGACRAPVRLRVGRVVDGDTIHGKVLDAEGALEFAETKVRLIGVDTPELGYDGDLDECFATESTAFSNALWNGWVWLTFDQRCTDDYNRTLAYVHLGVGEQDFFQRQLLRGGYAQAFPWEDTAGFSELFAADEAAAIAAGSGGWSACGWN